MYIISHFEPMRKLRHREWLSKVTQIKSGRSEFELSGVNHILKCMLCCFCGEKQGNLIISWNPSSHTWKELRQVSYQFASSIGSATLDENGRASPWGQIWRPEDCGTTGGEQEQILLCWCPQGNRWGVWVSKRPLGSLSRGRLPGARCLSEVWVPLFVQK